MAYHQRVMVPLFGNLRNKDKIAAAAQSSEEQIEHHRDLHGGAIRAGIFGISDGLVTNLSLILGVAGAHSEISVIRLSGMAGLVAGALSMAAGEYVSMAAQRELLERELGVEQKSIAANPETERQELVAIYLKRGLSAELADTLSTELMRRPEQALETHAREELGIDPRALGSPIAAAVSSFVAFAVGALIPLVPWFFARSTGATVASILLSALSALVIGGAIGLSTGRQPWLSALRQLAIGGFAGGVTYGIGALVGVQL